MMLTGERQRKAAGEGRDVSPMRGDRPAAAAHPALERRPGAAAVTGHRDVLGARAPIPAQHGAVHQLAAARPIAGVIQLSSKDGGKGGKESKEREEKHHPANKAKYYKGNNNAAMSDGEGGEGGESGDDDDAGSSGEEEKGGYDRSAQAPPPSKRPSDPQELKVWLRDRLWRAQNRAAARAGRAPKHRAAQTAYLPMVGRTNDGVLKPHPVVNPFGTSLMAQGGHKKPEQPNVRLDPAVHPGLGGHNTSTKYSSMSPAIDGSQHGAAIIDQLQTFHQGTGPAVPTALPLSNKLRANASLIATTLAVESHESRLGDGGKYIRAGLAVAKKKGKLLPSFNTARGKSGVITAEGGGQGSFRKMMTKPKQYMKDHHVATLDEMSSSSDDSAAEGQAVAASPSAASLGMKQEGGKLRSARLKQAAAGNNNAAVEDDADAGEEDVQEEQPQKKSARAKRRFSGSKTPPPPESSDGEAASDGERDSGSASDADSEAASPKAAAAAAGKRKPKKKRKKGSGKKKGGGGNATQ